MTPQGKTSEGAELAHGYEKISPLANYAPWLEDDEFQKTLKAISGHTLVDAYRCYGLWKLVEQTAMLPGDMLEVGVWRGGSGALIARKATLSSAGTACTVYLADTFEGVAKAGPRDGYYRGGEHANTSPEVVMSLLASLDVQNAVLLEGIFPEDTGARIAGNQFCFCHIDVDVYQSASDVLEWVWPRLGVGGVVVYDDYGFYGCEGVTAHVNEKFPASDRIVVHNLNGQAVMVKTGG